MTPLLTVNELTVELAPGLQPVSNLSLSLNHGETYALVGESGCGKSMTALALVRLLPEGGRVVQGKVALSGQSLLALTEAQMRGHRGGEVAMIFQEPATSLNPVLNIEYQLVEALARHSGHSGAAARGRALELLTAVGIPDPAARLASFPFQLSGGMKQRVMIAMALAGEPKLLIADEPTTALDVTIQAQVLELLATIQSARGMGMLLITHDLGVVARMAHRVGVMYAGELVEEGRREDFFHTPLHPYARRLFAALPRTDRARLATIPGTVPPLGHYGGGCRFAARCSEVLPVCTAQAPDWHEAASGQRVRCHLFAGANGGRAALLDPMPQETMASAEGCQDGEEAVLLDVRDLAVHFPIRKGVLRREVGRVKAVDGLNLQLYPGRTLALVGESGCGKTTAGKAMLRLIPPTAGHITLAGEDLAQVSPARLRQLRGSMQMIFQDPYASLDPRMRVGEIITEGLQSLGLLGSRAQGEARLAQLLSAVGLSTDMASRYPHEFSGGQRQRIAIARALAVEPRFLVCDEPTSALDVSVQAQILNLLKELQSKLKLSYLFISHNLAVVQHLAHEVAVMYLGRVVESGPVALVLNQPGHPYTEALLSAVPVPGNEEKSRQCIVLQGDMPSPAAPPAGCYFHPRCPRVQPLCAQVYPAAQEKSAGHRVACHFPQTSDG